MCLTVYQPKDTVLLQTEEHVTSDIQTSYLRARNFSVPEIPVPNASLPHFTRMLIFNTGWAAPEHFLSNRHATPKNSD